MKPFYIHINPFNPGQRITGGRPRAATFLITENKDPNKVNVQAVLCSRDDAFCKKTGRELAQVVEDVRECNKRRLPGILAECERLMTRKEPKDYNYILRNFV